MRILSVKLSLALVDTGLNFLLMNVGRGLSAGSMSSSSSSSADVNPYPSYPSSVESMLQMDKECDEKSFG
jgi:hypothetical protein